MASVAMQFIVFVFICGVIPMGNYAQELENDQACEAYCEENFNPSAARSCGRGCRFFVISKFLKPAGDLRAFCKGSCEEAYGIDDPNFLSCDSGCGKQFSLTEEQSPAAASSRPAAAGVPGPEGEAGEGSGGLELHLVRPVMQVRRVVASVMCNLRILKKSVLTYFMRDDNTIMAVESNPEVMVEISPMENADDECAEQPHPPASQPEDGPDARGSSPWSLENMNPFSSRVHDASASDESATVMRVSLHSTRYTYLLHLLLLLAAVSLSLLALSYCFAVARHQRRQAAKAANLAIAVQSEPLKLVRPEELTKLSLLEDDQAAPLPNKHDLALMHAAV